MATGKNASLIIAVSSTVGLDSAFTVDLLVEPSGTPINLVYATLIYPTSSVRLIGKDESMSPFAIRLSDPTKADTLDEVIQAQPNPGIDQLAMLAQFTFVAVRSGTITIGVAPSSSVFANDGLGTNVLGSIETSPITILPVPTR